MQMKKRIFISSTYEDLQTHRRRVWELLEEFDVQVKGMEKFGARKDAPLETCIKEVKSSEIYVGIIACRLGTIDKISGKSFTRLEYEKASELKKEIMIYMIDEKSALIQPIYVDRGDEKFNKLEEFKNMLKQERTVETFINEEDLVEKLRRDLKKHLSIKKDTSEYCTDEFEKSSVLLKKLLLAPLSYSGNLIKIKINIKGDYYPASKEICDAFNLKFGATVGLPVTIVIPKGYENVGIDELYMDPKLQDALTPILSDKVIEIYARPQFSEKNIVESRARFKSETQTVFQIFDSNSTIETKHYEPDGKIILLLSSIEHHCD